MDVRSPLFQNIALIVAGVLFLNPIVATAAQLAVDQAAGGNTAVTQAQNGVPMVNIATPNGSGLSHNKFTDYNVGQQGLILNNSAQNLVQTQLGGYVVGNPNLKNGAAGLILNEVTGGNASQLKGYTEVAGRSAAVIVANPHGITCDGCGFINTPRVTLSTGTPIIENGRLQRFDVDGGQISIEGQGLNAGNVDQFDLITRSAQINAELHAKKLNIITGRNEVNATTLAATAKADDGSNKPMLAIDSSALGGMYAGAIRLVGTEQGVGVKLAGDMAASAGDIQIDANGKLSLNRVAASGDVALKANTIDLNADTYAGRNATLEAQQVEVRESLAAGQRLTVQAEQLNNAGIIEAGVRANGSVSSAGHLQLDGGKVRNAGEMTSHGSMATDLQTLDNAGGKITTAGSATLKAEQLDNREGEILAQGNLTLDAAKLDNRAGSALSGQALTIEADSVDNAAGTLAAGGSLQVEVSERLNNTAGLIEAGGQVSLQAGALDNRSGKLRALGSGGESRLAVDEQLNNQAGQIEIGSASLAVEAGSLVNQDGLIRHVGAQALDMSLEQLGQAGGRIQTNAQLDLKSDSWTNTTELQAGRITLDIAELTQTTGAALLARDNIEAKGSTWRNDGRIETDGSLSLELEDAYAGDGTLIAQGDLSVSAAAAELGTHAKWLAGGSAKLSVLGDLVSRGQMTAGTWLQLAAQSLRNSGTIGAAGQLSLQAADIRNEDGFLFSGASMLLVADRFTNQRGDLYSVGDLQFVANEEGDAPELFSNLSGVVESEGNITIRAKQITNAHEVENLIVSRKIAALFYNPDCTDCSGDKENVRYRLRQIDRTEATSDVRTASLLAGGDLTLSGQAINNRYSMLAANGAVRITGDTFTSVGAETGEYVSEGRATSEREKSQGWIHDHVRWFNSRNWPTGSASIVADLNNVLTNTLKGSFEHFGTTYTPDAEQNYAAIVQAGGDVTINATEIGNASIRPSFSFVNGGTRVDTDAPGSDIATFVTLNPQLPPDLQQKAVDPLSLPGFSLPSGQNGLFSLNTNPGHRYLIETNPAFANLGNFLNSDYMLGLLGFDPDEMQRRLGDGFYEQRLVREAVRARTGQRYLAGLDSDEAQFKYLMDNALASKEALNLSLGITLSAEQVAALTHDIVWMEEREVQGQKVLVPVLYLAQAEGRLAPSGALIQGRDVALISGGDLNNSGTLRATQSLNLTAQQSIANSGLMHATERLSLLAGDSIRNTQGGILKGQDVSLVAVTGDVVNERTVSTHHSATRHTDRQQSFVDSAARIEAGNDLLVSAGKDIRNIGGAISAGGDASLQAGNDLILGSAEAENRQNRWDRKGHSYQTDITQYGSDVQVGGDLTAVAGRDLLVVGSTVKAGGDIGLGAGGDMTIASAANESSFDYYRKSGGKTVIGQEHHVKQIASVIEAGGNFNSASGNDTTLIASQIHAGDEAYLYAGGDIDLDAAQNSDYSYFYKKKKGGMFSSSKLKMSESSNSEAVSSYITAASDLTLRADKDVAARGAQLLSDSDIYLSAGGDVVLDAAENSSSQANAKAKSGFFSSKAKTSSSEATTLTGTRLDGQNIVIEANNDIALRAAGLRADDAIILDAGRDISISTAVASQQSSQASKSSSLKWHIFDSLATNGSLTLEQKSKGAQSSSSQEVGSTLSGATIDVTSGRDTAIRGSTLVADSDINVAAGRNLLITSGEAKDDSSARSSSKKTGEIGDWWQGATGVVSIKQSSQNNTTQQLGSQIASLGGNVELTAGEAYRQRASQVIAPQGDVSITAKRVDIEAGYDLLSSSQKQSSNRTAIGGSVSVPLIDAVQGAQRMIKAAGDTKDARLTALAAANTAMSGYQAYQSAQTLATGDFTGVKISVNLSNSQSKSGGTQSGQNVVASSVAAGRDITIKATGDGDASNLNVVGSTIDAGRNVSLDADGNINLVSAQNTAKQEGKNSNSGWSAGVGFGVGQQNGFTLELAANKGRGSSEGEVITHANTLVTAGEKVALNSGGDTNLKGAVVTAKQVTADVGGDLNLASQQDIDDYKSKQQNAGVGLSLCIPPFCAGVSTVSGSFSQQKINSKYASVGQQTGIKAGDGGFQIKVGGNTDLQGAIIASNDKAVADGKNSLTTGTLTHSDIENKAEYKGSSISLSGSYSTAAREKDGTLKRDENGKVEQEAATNAGTPIALSASGKDKSTTHSGISGGAITITDSTKQQALTGQTAEEAVADINRDVSSDRDGSNTLKPIFDRKEVEAGFEITEQFVRNVGTFLEQRSRESTQAKRELEAELAKPVDQQNAERITQLVGDIEGNATWEVGGLGRTLISAISGAAGGNVMGGGSQLLQGAAVSYLQGLAAEQVKGIADELESESARAALHAIVGCAGAAAQSQSCGAGALGGSASVVLNNLLDQLSDQTAAEMTDEQKQNRLNLIGSLVAGITAAAGGEAAVAANAAQIETGNNYLGTGLNLFGYQLGENQVKAFVEDIQDTCSSGPSQACVDTYNQWKETSYKQGGLETTEDREGWESLVHAAYEENVLPLCKGDLFCEINVNARMKLDTVMYAGDAVGLKDSVESVTRATNIANGNWVRLGLQVVGDVGLVTSIGGMVGGSAKATGEVATTVPRTPLAGPTGNWKNYTHAEAVIQTQASGRLVNAEKVVIDPNKVTSYALNTTHPVGGNKAKVFESALGYNQTNAASLIAKVQEGAKLYPAKLGASDKFGQRITIDMPITGPNGNTATVRTGWIYDPGSATPRMTTLYVK